MHKLATIIFFTIMTWAAYVGAQTCLVPAPTTPPRANQVIVNCPGDGGLTGCTMYAVSTTGSASPRPKPIGNPKCATACTAGDQAVAIDNGWDDGGLP